jgi:hypothetical protein
MELTLTPDIYTPSIDENGNYVDHQIINIKKNGSRCPCTLNIIYDTNSKWRTHTKSKKHQTYLCELNNNKSNLLQQNIELIETNKNQQKIIQELQNKNNILFDIVDNVTKETVKLKKIIEDLEKDMPSINLIHIDE